MLLNECAQKMHASMEEKSRISDQVAKCPQKDRNGFGQIPALRGAWSNEAFINEKLALLEELKGHYDDAFDELGSERQSVRYGGASSST